MPSINPAALIFMRSLEREHRLVNLHDDLAFAAAVYTGYHHESPDFVITTEDVEAVSPHAISILKDISSYNKARPENPINNDEKKELLAVLAMSMANIERDPSVNSLEKSFRFVPFTTPITKAFIGAKEYQFPVLQDISVLLSIQLDEEGKNMLSVSLSYTKEKAIQKELIPAGEQNVYSAIMETLYTADRFLLHNFTGTQLVDMVCLVTGKSPFEVQAAIFDLMTSQDIVIVSDGVDPRNTMFRINRAKNN